MKTIQTDPMVTLCNLHVVDQYLRILLAFPLIGQILFVSELITWHWSPLVVGLYFAMTALLAWDPIYQFLNIRSNNPCTSQQHSSETQSLGVIITRFHLQSSPHSALRLFNS